MTRSLPWKKTSGSTTSKDKGKSRARESDSEASDSNQSHSSQQKRKRTDRDDSDYQDDDNWRMTESELAATAKLWTQNLHQQAYEKLFHVQQKQNERSKTLNHLLDQPVVHQILPALPARIAVIKTKPEPFPQVDVAQSTSESSLVPISKAFSSTIVSKPSNLRKVDGIRSEDKDQPAAESSNQSAVPKLSEAALARRRKREQGRQTDVTTVPMF